MITHAETATNIQQVADDIYRIDTPVVLPDGQAFNFNQCLLADGRAAAVPHRPAPDVPANA